MNPLWRPSDEQIAAANMTALMRWIQNAGGPQLPDYPALYQWSLDEPAKFWEAVWRFCEVVHSRPWDTVVQDFDKLPGAKWFPGARLNFAENLLRYRDDNTALICWNESGPQRHVTFAQLADEVAHVAARFRAWGIKPGDRLVGFMPNLPETVVAMLAAVSLGAVWSQCSPDFGVQGVIDRFGQIEPRVLIACDGYHYAGKTFDTLDRVREIRERMPSVEQVVIVPYLHGSPDLAKVPGATLWTDLLQGSAAPQEFAQLPFDHPLYILFSSGTTGVPKCIVHSAGGTLLQHLKEHVLHCDLTRADRLFYFTTCGWMMWNWLVSALAAGTAIVLYDGSPLAPHAGILFDMAEAEGITVFGTSPKFLSAAEQAGVRPAETHDLAPLRAILSTGAPLNGEGYDYVYEHVKPDVRLSSISGGTDIVACFAIGNPILPVYRGELQCRALAMHVHVFSDQGESLVGEKGELVCTAPFPSVPLGFWNDPTGEKFHAAYFDHYSNIWYHGDFAELTDRGTMIVYGRSDAVLNPHGVRIGTAEIYRQVALVPEVIDSVVVAQEWQGDVRVVLFVKLAAGQQLTADLVAGIKRQIRSHTTPRHVPAKVLQVADIPRTKSGKIVERAVRDIIHGRPIKNASALENPEALDGFRNRVELTQD